MISGDTDNTTDTATLQYQTDFTHTTPFQEWMSVYELEVVKGIQETTTGETFITVKPLIWNDDTARGPINTWMRPFWEDQWEELQKRKVISPPAKSCKRENTTVDLSPDLVHKVEGK